MLDPVRLISHISDSSWDPYDLWSTGMGVLVRRAYYRGSLAGKIGAAALQLVDLLAPGSRALGCRKKRYASVMSQRSLAAAILAESHQDEALIETAERSFALLEGAALRLPGGQLAWGLPFDWQSSREHYPAATPFITQTAYALEAALQLHALTRRDAYLQTARGVAAFLASGVYVEPAGAGERCSYGPRDRSFVYNANSYRAFCLALAERSGIGGGNRGTGALEYVLAGQRQDGSWPYGDGPEYAYIDHYHTAFTLKNLLKTGIVAGFDDRLVQALGRGFAYYLDQLFDPETNLPRPFARKPRAVTPGLDGYDVAECIGLFALLRYLGPAQRERIGAPETRIRVIREALDRLGVVKGTTVLWRRYGSITLYREFDRWPRAPLALALAYEGSPGLPAYLARACR